MSDNPVEMSYLMCKKHLQNRKVLVDLLAIVFGIGSWIGINSMYLQLPLLVSSAPEGWSLPSYLVVIIQIANIGPILYTLFQKFSPRKLKDSHLIHLVFVLGIIASILMSFYYDKTLEIGGTERSVPMFIIVFFLALVGCTSSVLFMPYMGRFKEMYLITYLIGEGLSGFLPSIVALIQGVGGNARCVETSNSTAANPEFELYTPSPLFGTYEFFFFVFGVLIISFIAFIFLDRSKISRREYAAVVISNGNHYEYKENRPDKLTTYQTDSITSEQSLQEPETAKPLSKRGYYYLLALIGVVCMFGNGVFPSVQSYSCLPYGNVAYHLTVTLSSIANPLACFLAVFLKHNSIRRILVLVAIGTVIGIYAMSTSLMSPNPPLVGKVIGEILVVSRGFFSLFQTFRYIYERHFQFLLSVY